MKKILGFLNSLEGKTIILMHSAADVDSFSASAMLCFALKKKKKNVLLAAPDKLNLEAQKLASKLDISYFVNPSFNDASNLILVDFNSLKMLGALQERFLEFKGSIALIDHHSISEDKIKAQAELIQKHSISTTVIVYDLMTALKVPLDKRTAILLASGIISDSAHFLVADEKSFLLMSEALKKSNKDYLSILDLFHTEADVSEKIASLKALRRAKIYRVNDFLLCTSTVSTFEAKAAIHLVKAGADAAFVVSGGNKETRLSARANNSFVEKTGYDLTKVLHGLDVEEKKFPGAAGGHAAAAGFTGGPGIDSEALLKKCIELSHELLSKKFPGIQLKEY